jgi:hypothetical protein
VSVSEKVSISLKKTPLLSDKKTNPDFFHKLENGATKASGDWQIKVAVPWGLLPTGLSLENGSTEGTDSLVHFSNGMEPITGTDSQPVPNGFGGFVTPKDSNYKDQTEMKSGMNGSQLKKMPNQECPVDRAPRMNVPASAQDSEQTSWDAGLPATSPDSSSVSYDEAAASAGAGSDWAMVCHQFQNMEHQQCIIMEMLQVTISFPYCLFQLNLDLLKHGNPGMRHLNNRSWLEQ